MDGVDVRLERIDERDVRATGCKRAADGTAEGASAEELDFHACLSKECLEDRFV